MTTKQIDLLLSMTMRQATVINRRIVALVPVDAGAGYGYSIEGNVPVSTAQAIRSLTLFR